MLARWAGISRKTILTVKTVEPLWKITSARGYRVYAVKRWSLLKSKSNISGNGTLCTIRSFKSSNVVSNRNISDQLGIWKVLEWLGVSHCKIVTFRRRIKRFTYPWLAYSIPTAFVLGLGDLIAQYHLQPHCPERTLWCFFSCDWNAERTLAYFLLGLVLVGPAISWWNLFWFRKLRCSRHKYFIIKILVDLLILSPFLLSLMALIMDQRYGVCVFTDDFEKTKKRVNENYWPAVKEVLVFSALTRPLMVILNCYVVPSHLRRTVRTLYEVGFAAFLADAFYRHKIRVPAVPPPPPPPPPPTTVTSKSGKRPSFAWKWPC